MTEEQMNRMAIAFSVTCMVVGGLGYAITVRTEREKRKKIEAWKQENLACIAKFEKRLIAAAQDPNITIEEYWKIFHEENQFLKIVQAQRKF